jgi:hypothetical protein
VSRNSRLFPEDLCGNDTSYAGHGQDVTDIYGKFKWAFWPDL